MSDDFSLPDDAEEASAHLKPSISSPKVAGSNPAPAIEADQRSGSKDPAEAD
jgi:hypothetical protein